MAEDTANATERRTEEEAAALWRAARSGRSSLGHGR